MTATRTLVGYVEPRDDSRSVERDLRLEIDRLRNQLNNAQDSLRQAGGAYGELRARYDAQERALSTLRTILQPLYGALQGVFGELDAIGPSNEPGTPPKHKAVWDQWKTNLGGLPARFIDALLTHGPMTRTQLRIAVGCANGSVTDTIYKLNRAGLINKRADQKIELKEL